MTTITFDFKKTIWFWLFKVACKIGSLTLVKWIAKHPIAKMYQNGKFENSFYLNIEEISK